MNRKLKKILAGVLLVAAGTGCFSVGRIYGAGTKTPGTQSDPLVSLSYLEERLEEINDAAYTKVVLKNGKTLYAELGSELMLYSGSAKVCAAKGIVSLTKGLNVASGSSIELYSLYFVPFDGNAITAVTDCTLYIKGSYRISESK